MHCRGLGRRGRVDIALPAGMVENQPVYLSAMNRTRYTAINFGNKVRDAPCLPLSHPYFRALKFPLHSRCPPPSLLLPSNSSLSSGPSRRFTLLNAILPCRLALSTDVLRRPVGEKDKGKVRKTIRRTDFRG